MISRLAFVLMLWSLASGSAAAQDAVSQVRELYAAAAYEDALSAVDRLKAETLAPALELDRYQALCLIDDLRMLAVGFLDLSRASIPAATPAEVKAADEPTPPVRGGSTSGGSPPSSDPIAIRQDLPPWSVTLVRSPYAAEFRGAIEVEIDERGEVVGASIVDSIHPSYDPVLLKAAQSWKYEPARRLGNPVKARKRVDVVLRPR